MEKKKAGLCREFGLVNSMLQTTCKIEPKFLMRLNRTDNKAISRACSCGIGMALPKWFKHERSDNVSVRGPSSYDNFCSSYS